MESTKPVKFSRSIIKQFHNLVECPLTMAKRVSMLEDMEDILSVRSFGRDKMLSLSVEYDSEEKRILGMKYLLGTWEVLLDGVNNVIFSLGFVNLASYTRPIPSISSDYKNFHS